MSGSKQKKDVFSLTRKVPHSTQVYKWVTGGGYSCDALVLVKGEMEIVLIPSRHMLQKRRLSSNSISQLVLSKDVSLPYY